MDLLQVAHWSLMLPLSPTPGGNISCTAEGGLLGMRDARQSLAEAGVAAPALILRAA